MTETVKIESRSPEETYKLGRSLGATLAGGETILLSGGLGAGKTLLTKGILDALGFDPDEVTSPSFTLVNLYPTERFDVYHIDLWRIDDRGDAAREIGLEEILEDPTAVAIIEWSERLGVGYVPRNPIRIAIGGDGDDPRRITMTLSVHSA